MQTAWYYNKRQAAYDRIAERIGDIIVKVMREVGDETEKHKEEQRLHESLGLLATPALPQQLKYTDEKRCRVVQVVEAEKKLWRNRGGAW